MNNTTSTYPLQGPHCDQFLRKMGLAKGEAAEAEDHFCDMSYVNIVCTRWRANCAKMEAILKRGDPLCIEVYLGPSQHKILLEQWIIVQKEKVPPPTMTLQSLCSAIRSQLYFSQISAWCDLIKKSDDTIYETGRVINPIITGAAGDLATPNLHNSPAMTLNTITQAATTASPISPSSSLPSTSAKAAAAATIINRRQQQPRLHIYYRIKQYDSTASFNSKPNVHNFPNVNISENSSISVCLKSLPRINGGIPKIGVVTAATMSTSLEMATATTPNTSCNSATTKNGCYNKMTFSKINHLKKFNNYEENNSIKSQQQRLGGAGAITRIMTTTVPPTLNCDKSIDEKAKAAANNVINNEKGCSADDGSNSSNGNNVGGNAITTTPKCTFYIDEDELDIDDYDDDLNNDSNATTSHLSHREKQLMKYRKRMQKRDKKQTKSSKPTIAASEQDDSNDDFNMTTNSSHQPMEESDDELNARHQSSTKMISTGTQTQMTCCQQCGSEKTLICLNCCPDEQSCIPLTSHDMDASIDNDACSQSSSCSGSLSSSDIIHTPRNKAELLLQAIQRTPKTAAKHKKKIEMPKKTTIQNNNHVGGADGGATNIRNGVATNAAVLSGCQVCKRQKTQHNFNSRATSPTNVTMSNSYDNITELEVSANVSSGSNSSNSSRSKHSIISDELNIDEHDDDDGGKGQDECDIKSWNSARIHNDLEDDDDEDEEDHIDDVDDIGSISSRSRTSSDMSTPLKQKVLEEECFTSSTKLTPQIERFSLNSIRPTTTLRGIVDMITLNKKQYNDYCTPPIVTATTNNTQKSSATSLTKQFDQNELQLNSKNYINQPKAITTNATTKTLTKIINDNITPCSSNCNTSNQYNLFMQRKCLPKVNLTPIFCNPTTATSNNNDHQLTSLSSPIPINAQQQQHLHNTTNHFSFDSTTKVMKVAAAASKTTIIATSLTTTPNGTTMLDNIPVQKSFSAPTLPNSSSPSLSPRFSKQAAIYKRRSRHLSDRSDRSSLGSDEQISDEDFENGCMFSPATSPMKMRARLGLHFGRLPLLGNLEEILLQRRLMPKIEVMGFKVLLGAAGCFCPTHLTIPANTYFYELHGAGTLSTPYVSEVRLPRKGYNVPRAGNIQATLLNPMGTVVRMFVIPYDMRDMPPLHQTFIRQRVLAGASSDESTTTVTNKMTPTTTTTQTNGIGNTLKTLKVTMMNQEDNVDIADENNCDDSEISKNYNNFNNNKDCSDKNPSTTKYHRSPSGGLHSESNLGHFISAEHMKRLRYSIHLKFQTSRSGRLLLHTNIRVLISRRTDCDTAAAHTKGVLETPSDLITDTVMPMNPKYSARQDNANKI